MGCAVVSPRVVENPVSPHIDVPLDVMDALYAEVEASSCSSGSDAMEPSTTVIRFTLTRTKVYARVFHGVTGDIDQYRDEVLASVRRNRLNRSAYLSIIDWLSSVQLPGVSESSVERHRGSPSASTHNDCCPSRCCTTSKASTATLPGVPRNPSVYQCDRDAFSDSQPRAPIPCSQ